MASLAESSIASVSLKDLAAVREHLAKIVPGNVTDRMQHPSALTPSTLQRGLPIERVPEAAIGVPQRDRFDNTNDTANASAVIPDSGDLATPPAAVAITARPPHLTSARSAPEADMEAMKQQTPSQQAFKDMTRAESFSGFLGGDTQPMDSQIYHQHFESMALAKSNTNTVTPQKPVMSVRRSPDGRFETYDTTVTDKTPHTFVEGETGFIDLEGALQSEHGSPGMRSTTSGIDELLATPQTQLQALEVARIPTMPETPSLAGHKRRSSGEIVSSTTVAAKKTPGFSQVFGFVAKGPAMSATQLFAQTQAPSSPMPDAPRSDPLLTRPSPNMLERTAFSSPPVLRSSPLMTMHSRPTSAATEDPKENYTSMQESDERRRVREIEQEANAVYPDVDDFDVDDDFVRPRLPNTRMQRVMSDQTLHELARRRAPSRPPLRPGSSRGEIATIDLITPATVRQRPGRVEFGFDNVSDDGEPMDEDEHHEDGLDLGDDDDVYDEYAQTVLRSQPDGDNQDDIGEDDHIIEQADEMHDQGAEEAAGNESNGDLHLDDGDGENSRDTDNVAMSGDVVDVEKAVTATQRSAVADSQPLPGEKRRRTHLETIAPSSTTSFVPGSQYAGRTSEEQAFLRRDGLRQISSGDGLLDKVPSSPPLLATNDTLPSDPLGASLARQQALALFQPQQQEHTEQETEREIPESDALQSEPARPRTADVIEARSKGQMRSATESNSMPAPFSTAQTHLSAGGPSPLKPQSKVEKSPYKMLASQRSRMSLDSPRKRAGVRNFADIAADPSPPEASGEAEVDIEAMMSDVYTAEDHAFLDAMSSPASEKVSKRRRLNNTVARQVSSVATSPTRAVADEAEPVSEQAQANLVPLAVPALEHMEMASPHVLQSNESRGNELPTSTPENADALKGTQDSTKKREQAGAAVVSQLLAARSTKTGQKLSGLGRRTTTSVELEVAPKKIDTATRRKSRIGKRKVAQAASTPAEAAVDDTETALAPLDGSLDTAAPVAMTVATDEVNSAAVAHADKPAANAVLAPMRVFALFKGTPTNFYPATWLEAASDGKGQTIRFDDNTAVSLDRSHISMLELRVGDNVKVDGAGMRNKSWVVRGFGDVARTVQERAVGSDIYGHTTIQVQAKTGGRDSTAGTDGPMSNGGAVIDVLINRIYLTPTMWSAFSKREFIPPHPRGRNATRLDTPTIGLHTPDAETPGSRVRRSIIPSAKATAQKSHLRDDSVTSKHAHKDSGLFDNMAFAISYGSNEAVKQDITASIQRNGGMILNSGFEELFDLPTLADADEQGDDGQTGLHLKKQYAGLGFVALIADRHSRRAKYVQALALGLPTLSGRWITDSLKAASGEGKDSAPVPWSKYLLAAGESSYLGGAVRSRTITSYDAAEAKLIDTITNRELLLAGDNVLIVASQKHKAWDRRKAYAFLTLALGAARVKRVIDVASARSILKTERDQWQWVYVDGSVVEASKILFGLTVWNAAERERERMRGDDGVSKGDAKVMVASSANGVIKAVNDEFVVQSLILGALVD
ncbi:radiation sensitive protein rad9 [Recurvomyces mirabilis]|uniref:Radiation sensitive protein rad9 n=1 Tax=Recurvomyces mirabilis TaxID=574656 RepID=A0AAE0WXN1_9PEZI|nr:radiation sensitive protein rad9 [Recurvomyces mirabilis]KAK5161886.1 radiation sensitive protein rad9 [Recurvomyces mirabilis]